MKTNLVGEKAFCFALEIIKLYRHLLKEQEYIFSKQLLRAATSIGANLSESVSAQSRKDFLHKYELSLKEAREAKFWLLLLQESQFTSFDCKQLLLAIEEIIKLLASSVKTIKENLHF